MKSPMDTPMGYGIAMDKRRHRWWWVVARFWGRFA